MRLTLTFIKSQNKVQTSCWVAYYHNKVIPFELDRNSKFLSTVLRISMNSINLRRLNPMGGKEDTAADGHPDQFHGVNCQERTYKRIKSYEFLAPFLVRQHKRQVFEFSDKYSIFF